MILDVGRGTVQLIEEQLARCRTAVWNGPLGAFEIPPFDEGTMAVARKVAELTKAGKLMSVVGGGDTIAALAEAGVLEQMSYVSTAGGAFLEWLEGKELPGVAVLRQE
jgi:phosphoglycerate kinase